MKLMVPVLDHTKWEAMCYEWRSPLGQLTSMREVDYEAWGSWSIKAFTTCPPKPLLEVCATQCLWRLGSTILLHIRELLCLPLPKSNDVFDVLQLLLKGILKISDEQHSTSCSSSRGGLQSWLRPIPLQALTFQ